MNRNIDKKLVGQKIKNIRLEKGMTLEEFGKMFGASKSNVRSWEIGTNLPNPERLKTIAKIADITVEELLANPKQDYALKHCKKSLDELISYGDPFPEFPQATFTKKYYDELIDLFKDSLSSYDLDKYSNEEIEEITDKILGDLLLRTPKNTF